MEPPELLLSTEEAGGNAGGTGKQLEGKSLLNGDQVIVPGRGQELGVVPSYLVLPTERNVQGSKFEVSVTSVRLPFLTHLNNYSKAEVEIEISSEGGGSGCEAVVAHGGHHPVKEHHH